MAPPGIYATEGEDKWIGFSVRNESDWAGLVDVAARDLGRDARFATMSDRLANEDALDAAIAEWTRGEERFALAGWLQANGVPATAVQRLGERVDDDPDTAAWGLWPTVKHSEMGDLRLDGLPVHLSGTEWHVEPGAPCLGEDNEYVFGELLGVSADELASLREEGVL